MAAAEKMDQEYFIANDLTVVNLTVVNMAREIAEAFEGSEGPIPAERLCTRLDIAERLCTRLDIPTEFGESVLDRLVEKEILARTVEPRPGFTLARAPARITLAEIAEAVAAAALAQPNLHENETLGRLVRSQRQFLAKHSLQEILKPAAPETAGLSDIPDMAPQSPERDDEPSTPASHA